MNKNNENLEIPFKNMKIIDFHNRIMRIMKIQEFHVRITKIMEIIEFK